MFWVEWRQWSQETELKNKITKHFVLLQANYLSDRLEKVMASILWVWVCGPAKLNSMAWVRERTIPAEQPPLVGKVTANFLRTEGATCSAWRIPTAVFSVL
jgi:hypothetical protein